jgi:hypothetical protein
MPLGPDDLFASPEAIEQLGQWHDFQPGAESGEPAWFAVDGISAFRQIGRDGAGGFFALLPPAHCVLYVSSEGQAGIVAADFEAFIQLIVAHPYWHDILHFSGNGRLGEMRRAAEALEATLDDGEEVDESRDWLRSAFALAEPADPVGALHRAVSTSDAVVRPHGGGEPFTTLFNRFTIDDSPLLRETVD